MSVAQNIIATLGNSHFIAMTGAKHFTTSGNDVTFKIGRNAGKVTHVKITLELSDTYTTKFFAVRGTNIREIASREMVYGDQLRDVFESVTGMYTSL